MNFCCRICCHIIALLSSVLLFLPGCKSLDSALLGTATTQAIQAALLTDEQVVALSAKAAIKQDASHTVAPVNNPYAERLNRLVARHQQEGDVRLNYKVYLSDSVNAFAMADGTIRVYQGLMDKMTDEELLFVIGHEIGHVVMGHSRKQAQVAYATSAVRTGVASVGGTIGSLAQSTIGEISEKIINAQYSQKEEREADDFGLVFLQKYGYPPEAAVQSLRKLGNSGGGIMSTHPNSVERAERLSHQISGR